jgi:Na+/glutamate symporter
MISVPLVVVLGVIVWIAWRFMGLRTWQAVLCILLGFLLAATSSAPTIRHIMTGIVRSLTGH